MNDSYKLPLHISNELLERFLSEEEICSIVRELAEKINQDFENQNLVVIGLLKGSLSFMANLVRHFRNITINIDFVQLKSVGRSKENNGTIVLSRDIEIDIANKNVLIVSGILDSGRALNFLIHRLKLSKPQSISIVTLIDKNNQASSTQQNIYIGKKTNNTFLLGNGLDIDEYGRNLKGLHSLKYPN